MLGFKVSEPLDAREIPSCHAITQAGRMTDTNIAKRLTDLAVPSALPANAESLTIVKILPNCLEAVIIQMDGGGKLILISDCIRDFPG